MNMKLFHLGNRAQQLREMLKTHPFSPLSSFLAHLVDFIEDIRVAACYEEQMTEVEEFILSLTDKDRKSLFDAILNPSPTNEKLLKSIEEYRESWKTIKRE